MRAWCFQCYKCWWLKVEQHCLRSYVVWLCLAGSSPLQKACKVQTFTLIDGSVESCSSCVIFCVESCNAVEVLSEQCSWHAHAEQACAECWANVASSSYREACQTDSWRLVGPSRNIEDRKISTFETSSAQTYETIRRSFQYMIHIIYNVERPYKLWFASLWLPRALVTLEFCRTFV